MLRQVFFHSIALCLCLSSLFANNDGCAPDLVVSYFPAPFVESTLEKFGVPEQQKGPILHDLQKVESVVNKKVAKQASQFDDNFMSDPSQRDTASQFLKETLTAAFNDVMRKHGYSNPKQIEAMLEDIQKQKSQHFVSCLEKNADNFISNH